MGPAILFVGLLFLLFNNPSCTISNDFQMFLPASNNYTKWMGPNLLKNPSFESNETSIGMEAKMWGSMQGIGYSQYERTSTGRNGSNYSIKLFKHDPWHEGMAAYQYINLFQKDPKPIFFSGWSKAENVTGTNDPAYSVYIDVTYSDYTSLWGQTIDFSIGTHDWEYKFGYIFPEKPILTLSVYCIFRYDHLGEVYFDDLFVSELGTDLVTKFDSHVVARVAEKLPPSDSTFETLKTSNGLVLKVDRFYGTILGTSIDNVDIAPISKLHIGGVFVRDVAGPKGFQVLNGPVTKGKNYLSFISTIESVGIQSQTTYSTLGNALNIKCIFQNIWNATIPERSLTIYIGIPIASLEMEWIWGDYIRKNRNVKSSSGEFAYLTTLGRVGSNKGYISLYPFAAMKTTNLTKNVGISLSVSMDEPRIFRIAFNPSARMLYAAFDIGLSNINNKTNSGFVSVNLFKLPIIGETFPIRIAISEYSKLFPSFFQSGLKAEDQGAWVAFSDISKIENVEDFGIGIHEVGSLERDVLFGSSHNIKTFRYLSESSTAYLQLNRVAPEVDPSNYTQVISSALDCANNSRLLPYFQQNCQWALVNGIKSRSGYYVFSNSNYPWCPSPCAVFTINPLPTIETTSNIPQNFESKFKSEWNPEIYSCHINNQDKNFNLSGEFFDSWASNGEFIDYSTDHIASLSEPYLGYSFDNPSRVGVVQLFSSFEFARNISKFLRLHKKLSMANGVLLSHSVGVNLFDQSGTEVMWINYNNGQYYPLPDSKLSYFRTLVKSKPYNLLMNVQFSYLTDEIVETYFRHCSFYGFYPSFFSADAMNSRYWDNPSLYNRHRLLFKKYIPKIKEINRFGWQPILGATLQLDGKSFDETLVKIERFSYWPNTLYFTLGLNNQLTNNQTLTISIDIQSVLHGDNKLLNCSNSVAKLEFSNVYVSIEPKKKCSFLEIDIPVGSVINYNQTSDTHEIISIPFNKMLTTVTSKSHEAVSNAEQYLLSTVVASVICLGLLSL